MLEETRYLTSLHYSDNMFLLALVVAKMISGQGSPALLNIGALEIKINDF